MQIRSSTLTSIDVLRLIELGRDAELCRNLDAFREILSVFWSDVDFEPDVSAFPISMHAELLRLCGVYLSQTGRAKGLADRQLQAKDILGLAIRKFEAQGLFDKAAETKVALANCYWFSGEVKEYNDLIESVEEEFSAAPNHSVLIQIKLNRLLIATWKRDIIEAKRLVRLISSLISSIHDFRLHTQFNNLAGITFRLAGDLNTSAQYLSDAVYIAREKGNRMFVAFNLNNLAMVYRNNGDYQQAHRSIEEAISILESRNDLGWIPHALDTKALIYLDQAEYTKALETIDRSISIFIDGEDYSGFTDAMWTKCLCLFRLKRMRDAMALFTELTDIAARQIGQIAVDKFEKLLAEEVYLLKHFPLADELAALKRSLVIKALRETGGHMATASKALGLKSQQHLSQILNREFPDIYDELGIKRRARRGKPSKQKPAPAGLSRLIMPKNRTFSFNFAWRGKQEPEFFYFPRDLMREFRVRTAALVAVMPVKSESLFDGGVVLYSYDATFRIGRLAFDELAELFLVDVEKIIFLADVQLIGVPVGYCPVSERNKRILKFERLQLPVKHRL